MKESLQVTLIANAGLLLRYQGVALILDGIYDGEGHPFSAPSPRTMAMILNGEPPFEKLDFLIFSHTHSDHFSVEITMELLRRRRVKGILTPDDVVIRESGLLPFLRKNQIPYVALSGRVRDAAFRITPNIMVHAFQTLHLDKKYHEILHFCYLISFGEKNVLFTSDVDYTTERMDFMRGTPLRAAFVNPLFFNDLQRGRFFRGSLHAENICVYHIPFSRDDILRLRPALTHALLDWPEKMPPPIIFCDELQTEEL